MHEAGASGFIRGINAVRLDLADMLGAEYVMSTVIDTLNVQRIEEGYRVYETDCLYAIATALGIKMQRRYYDVLHPSQDTEEDNETARERLERFGIKVVD